MTPANAALALLSANSPPLTRKAGAFLGQLITDLQPLTDKQAGWLAKLLERASLPPVSQEGKA